MNHRFSQRFPQRFSRLMGASLAGLAVSLLSACMHQPPREPSPHPPVSEAEAKQMHERMLARISSDLNLDAAQKQNLQALASTLQEQHQRMLAEREPRAELSALMAGSRFDVQGAQALANNKSDTMKASSPKVITAFATFFDSLRPEQQQKVRDFMNRPPEPRGRWHGSWQFGLQGNWFN